LNPAIATPIALHILLRHETRGIPSGRGRSSKPAVSAEKARRVNFRAFTRSVRFRSSHLS